MAEMNDEVERVARAICESEGFEADEHVLEGTPHFVAYLPQARAAIEALRTNLPADVGEVVEFLRAEAAHYDKTIYKDTVRKFLAAASLLETLSRKNERLVLSLAEQIGMRVVRAYDRDCVTVARICDDELDRSGNMLGWVREVSQELARASQEARP